MQSIENILQQLNPISLKEMDSVKLMNRTDTKYVFTEIQLPNLLSHLANDYRVLEVSGKRISKYESLYFDTPEFNLYYAHHRGKLNRYKVRFRKYVESDLNFFEIKFKNNKGRTIKDRVKQKFIPETINDNAEYLLNEKTSLQSDTLEAKLWVNYSRITLVNINYPERVTLDINLHFKNDTSMESIDNIVIAEVKQDKAFVSPFIKVMKQYHIREGSISKYCFGVINLFKKIKHNNFKPHLILLKKVLYDSTARY